MLAEDHREPEPVGSTLEEHVAASEADEEYRRAREALEGSERIARLLIRYRMDLGLTQKQVAARVGTTYSVISRIESGQHPTGLATLRRVSRALGLRLVVGFETGPVNDPERVLVTMA